MVKMQASRRTYSPEFKAGAVADVPKLGVSAAARKHGISEANLSRWAAAAGVKRSTPRVSNPPEAERASPENQPKAVSRSDRSQAKKPKASPGATTRAADEKKPPAADKRVVRRYTPSQKAEAIEWARAHGVTAAARHLGITRFSIYLWLRQSAKAASGECKSPTSGPVPADVEAARDAEILNEWKKHPGLGPSQIRNQLRRAGVKVSVNTVRRVMEDAGYRPPKVRREPHDKRYESVRPNHMWHLDFVQRYINRASTFTLILIDDYSRFVVGHGVDDAERANFVVETFETAVARHGRPESVMHDKGSAFWSWRGISRFTSLLAELGVDQVVAEKKEWNGKVEAFNGNLHTELFDVHRFYDLAEMRRRLAAHIDWYNQARTHHALGGLLVPADRYYGRVEQVLARIEAGAGRDPGDLNNLRDRCLELFRVTSHGGVPEVWLLGRRLLGSDPSS